MARKRKFLTWFRSETAGQYPVKIVVEERRMTAAVRPLLVERTREVIRELGIAWEAETHPAKKGCGRPGANVLLTYSWKKDAERGTVELFIDRLFKEYTVEEMRAIGRLSERRLRT